MTINLTLAQCFGESATQNNETLTIYKSDLPGLTPDAENRAEQLLAALFLKLLEEFSGSLNDPQGQKITDPQGQTITYDNSLLYSKLKLFAWRINFITRNLRIYRQKTIVCQFFFLTDTDLTPNNF
ncbi:hypothetical protein [Tolypothrix sp. VBCCA 56010]|uniref:hypothetical protein n=1 Tax=Tolypothrix sp. VBCCA 56010 TaxID=3137731 RepID=UPI003D7E9FB7